MISDKEGDGRVDEVGGVVSHRVTDCVSFVLEGPGLVLVGSLRMR